jgi:hypothetical protein
MDFSAIGAAVTSLRLAGDIAKGLISLNTMAEVQAKAIELNEKIIDAQHRIFEANAAQSELVERVRKLEGEIARMKDWEAEKQRYQLVVPFTGCTVYALKASMSNGEAAHYLCANCFQEGKRSFLQVMRPKPGYLHFVCAGCNSQMDTRLNEIGPAKYAEDVKTWR